MDAEARLAAASVAVGVSLLASAALSVALVRLSFRSHCQDEAGDVKGPGTGTAQAADGLSRQASSHASSGDETSRLRYGAQSTPRKGVSMPCRQGAANRRSALCGAAPR